MSLLPRQCGHCPHSGEELKLRAKQDSKTALLRFYGNRLQRPAPGTGEQRHRISGNIRGCMAPDPSQSLSGPGLQGQLFLSTFSIFSLYILQFMIFKCKIKF